MLRRTVVVLMGACGQSDATSPNAGSAIGSVAVSEPLHVVSLGVGWAVMSDGRLRGWGGRWASPHEEKALPGLRAYSNGYLLFADGTVRNPYYEDGVLTEIGKPLPDLPPIAAVGFGSAWMITRTRTVIAIGDRAPLPAGASLGARIGGLIDAITVSGDYDRGCELNAKGEIRCWVSNGVIERIEAPPATELAGVAGHFCFVANGAQCFAGYQKPVPVQGLETATKLAMGRAAGIGPLTGMLCGILADGGVACATIDDDKNKLSAARRIGGIEHATQLAVSWRSACALARNGAMCWGENDDGQLGDGTRIDRTDAVSVIGLLQDRMPPPVEGNDAVPQSDAAMDWSGLPKGCDPVRPIQHLGPHGEIAEFPLVAAYAFVDARSVEVRLANYRVERTRVLSRPRGAQLRLALSLRHHEKKHDEIHNVPVDRGRYVVDDDSSRSLRVSFATSSGAHSTIAGSGEVEVGYRDPTWICGRYRASSLDGKTTVDSPWAARFVGQTAKP